MDVATWSICRAEFTFDGAFIDIRVPGTGTAEWEQFWTRLRTGPFALHAFRDGQPIPLPDSAAWALAECAVASVYVAVASGSVTANCHFFDGDLELVIDPREVNGEVAYGSVLRLMRFVAAAVGLPVVAVPEGGRPEEAFLRVSPGGQAESLTTRSVPPGCSCDGELGRIPSAPQ